MDTKDHSSAGDEQLVQAAQQGDMDAFEELVARHRDKIYARAFMMMHNESDAIDLSQDAWVKGWQRLNQFQGESSFASWMTRITINVCLDRLRWRKRHRTESIEAMNEESAGVESHLPINDARPSDRLERRELREVIDLALAQLPREQRAALTMFAFEDLDYKGIARAMSCSIGTVMSRLYYARQKLAVSLASARTGHLG
jgi:RNA polymerase sigma-70 factor (ECF subfamily)